MVRNVGRRSLHRHLVHRIRGIKAILVYTLITKLVPQPKSLLSIRSGFHGWINNYDLTFYYGYNDLRLTVPSVEGYSVDGEAEVGVEVYVRCGVFVRCVLHCGCVDEFVFG